MHLLRIILGLSLTGSSLASYSSPLRRRANDTSPALEPEPRTNQYIIEFAEESTYPSVQTNSETYSSIQGANYEDLVAEISARSNTKVLKKFDSSIFRGVAVEAISESPESLQVGKMIANAWQSNLVKLVPTIDFMVRSYVDPKNYSVHAMTGVDRLHEQGLYGKGVKIAIVDTGVEYTHSALGGGLGPGFKVEGGHDFLGDTYWPDQPVEPDDDPMDTNGHGTHVAGIAAGNGNWFKGVAPEASILSYKVFGLGPYTDDAILIEAFLRAYEDGADIITASIGSYSNWHTNPWAIVASRLVDEGIVVTIAAGNDGEEGPFRGSTGASGENVLAVASVDPSEVIAIPIKATIVEDGDSETRTIAYRPGSIIFPFSVKDVTVHALSLNTSVVDDGCLPLPEDSDLSGKIVLVRQSLLCDDMSQVDNIAPYGPAGILWYKHPQVEYLDPYSPYWDVPVGIITEEAGALIIEALSTGGKATLDFSEVDQYVSMPYSGGGIPSYFTSWGGLWDLTLKPDIAAPGAVITSSYLGNSYATMGGTSMATPYVAGVAALYISKHGGRAQHGKGFAKMLHARIAASGSSMTWPGNSGDGSSHLASPSQIGNGLINALKVLEYETQLSMTKFSLNDTLHFSRYQKVDITNNGKKDITYTFGVEAAGAYDALITENGPFLPQMNAIGWLKFYAMKPEVSFPAGGKFVVKPGQTRRAEFTFKLPSLPAGHKEANIPVYSGKVMIYGSNGEQLSVPFYGVLANVKKEIRTHGLFWKGLEYPRMYLPTHPVMATPWEKPYWSFETANNASDWPMLHIANIWGTQEIRWDIFEANWPERKWKWPLVQGQNGYIGTATFWRGSQATWFDGEKDDSNDIVNFPDMYLNRQYSHFYIWLGQLTNGSVIASGRNYTMRVAELLPFGEHERSDNWDIMSLPQIEIRPKA